MYAKSFLLKQENFQKIVDFPGLRKVLCPILIIGKLKIGKSSAVILHPQLLYQGGANIVESDIYRISTKYL